MDGKLLNEGRVCEKKWAPTKLLEGISDPLLRRNTAILLENQRLANLHEVATDSSDVAQFKRIAIPLVRRIYPNLIANKLVSVMPLLGPTGLVFYLRFRYSSDKGSIRGASNNVGFPTDDANSMQQDAAGNTNLNIHYSSQFVQNETTSVDDGADVNAVYSPLEHTPIFAGSLIGTVYDGSTAIQTFTVNASGTFTFADLGSPSPKVTAATLNLTTGEITATWNSAPGSNNLVVSYEYNMECNPDMPEVNLAIESESVTAITRKLKGAWSPESQQDIRSQFSLDLEEEITQILAQEINLEIDREIIEDLRVNAGTTATWDYNTALGDTIKERYESLYVKVAEVSNIIYRKTLRGGANWIVTSPEVATMFETATAGFAPAPSNSSVSSLGVQYVGTMSNKWTLYKDPHFQTNQLLLGYKGDNNLDAGYYYLPYIPLTQTPVVMDPESMCPRKAIMTRYGKKLLREGAKFYARVNIANFSI